MWLRRSRLGSLFGPLELRVLEAVWRRGREASVRDLLPDFPGTAYTTLMTTADRLYRKGVLVREKRGRAFVYRARYDREQLECGTVMRALAALLRAGTATPVLSRLVDEVSRHDEQLLEELERLIREKRRRAASPVRSEPER